MNVAAVKVKVDWQRVVLHSNQSDDKQKQPVFVLSWLTSNCTAVAPVIVKLVEGTIQLPGGVYF